MKKEKTTKAPTKKETLETLAKKVVELEGVVDGYKQFVLKLATDLHPAISSIQTTLATDDTRINDTVNEISNLRSKLIDINTRAMAAYSFSIEWADKLKALFKSIEHPDCVVDTDKEVYRMNGHKLGDLFAYCDWLCSIVSTIYTKANDLGTFNLNPEKTANVLVALGILSTLDNEEPVSKNPDIKNPFDKEEDDNGNSTNDTGGDSIL